ncbi:MAG: long-chain fatty acid--CoA ligase, partial [Bacteroidia bacterium]|nr:long-chain fatty acid--CoA ligase [Bacteroidia bacterium]
MAVTRVFDILEHIKKNHLKDDFVCGKELVAADKREKVWKKYSTTDFIDHANWVSYGLRKTGIEPGDKVAIISNNRPEWNFVDFGCQQVGAITVPIFPTVSNHDLQFIINDAEVKAIFISSKEIYKKLVVIEKNIPTVKFVYSFDVVEGLNSFQSLVELGKANECKEEIQKIKDAVKPEELFTILYTSGTTGLPKGVMLSHNNLVSNILFSTKLAPFEKNWKALSFLPLNHVYERMVTSLYFYMGTSVYYAEGFETIGDNLKEVKPQIFVSVPRLIERVYERLVSAGDKQKGLKKKIFFWALDLSLRYELNGANGGWYELKRKIADKLIYSKWREALGGNMQFIASGGAALQTRLARVFTCAKITILEAYGLTETSPAVSVNGYEHKDIRFGTVGTVLKNIEVKIAEDGEILIKGPSVMMGYYKKPEETAEVLGSDGWFHTGDIGTFVEERFLKITDRKKEIFKTSAGKYISPLMLENKLKECRFVEQCMVIGEGEKFASTLIVVSTDYIKEWCKKNTVEFT